MAIAFLVLPAAAGPVSGLAVFALAGLGCSAVFPLTITLASAAFPGHVSWVSSMLIAALMVGIGTGTVAIGALRDLLSFDTLYRLSAFYAVAMVLLTVVIARRRPG